MAFDQRCDFRNLLLFHLLFCTAFALQTLFHVPDIISFASLRSLEYPPSRVFGIFEIPVLNPQLMWFTGIAFSASLLAATLGIANRRFLILAILLYFLFFGQAEQQSYVLRKTNFFPLVILGLIATEDIRYCSWNTLVQFSKKRRLLPNTTSAWPILNSLIVMSFVYVCAVTAKFRYGGGLNWADGKTLQAYLLSHSLYVDTLFGTKLAQYPGLCQFLQLTTLVFESTFWLVIFTQQYRWVFASFGLAFHFGIFIALGIEYPTFYGLIYLVFLDMNVLHWFSRQFRWRWLNAFTSDFPRTDTVKPDVPQSEESLAHF